MIKNTLLLLATVTTLVTMGAGCATQKTGYINGETAPSTSFSSFAAQINQSLKNGFTLEEIDNPNLTLPSDINAGQIKKYFKINNILFALVLRNSMNVVLSLPIDFTPSFAGVLVAGPSNKEWSKLLEIRDSNPEVSSKNNPYYLFIENEKLHLTIVDQNGAGSGEGIMKVFALFEKTGWELKSCYYYSGVTVAAPINSDYFSFTAKLSQQIPKPIKTCNNNVQLISNE